MRKRAAERRVESEAARSIALERFMSKLKQVATTLHTEPVGPNSPDRPFHANFGFFMLDSGPPDGASASEREPYLRLAR